DFSVRRPGGQRTDRRLRRRGRKCRCHKEKDRTPREDSHRVAFLPQFSPAGGNASWLLGEGLERVLIGQKLRLTLLLDGGAENLLHEAGVKRVACTMRCDLAGNRTSDEREVANEIENLVAHEFIAEAQRAVHHSAVIENDRVLHRAASRESGGAHL